MNVLHSLDCADALKDIVVIIAFVLISVFLVNAYFWIERKRMKTHKIGAIYMHKSDRSRYELLEVSGEDAEFKIRPVNSPYGYWISCFGFLIMFEKVRRLHD